MVVGTLVLFVDMMQFGIAMLGRPSSVGTSMVTHMTCTQWLCCEARHYIVEYVSRRRYSVALSDHLIIACMQCKHPN